MNITVKMAGNTATKHKPNGNGNESGDDNRAPESPYDVNAGVKALSSDTKESKESDVDISLNQVSSGFREKIARNFSEPARKTPAPHPKTSEPAIPSPDIRILEQDKVIQLSEHEVASAPAPLSHVSIKRAENEKDIQTSDFIPVASRVDITEDLLATAPAAPINTETSKETLATRFRFSKETIAIGDLEKSIINTILSLSESENKEIDEIADTIINDIVSKAVGQVPDTARLRNIAIGMSMLLKTTKPENREQVLVSTIEEIINTHGKKEWIVHPISESIVGKGGVGIIHGGLFSISAKGIIPVVQKKVRTDINIKKQDGLIGHDSVMNNIIISRQNDPDYPIENMPHIIYADEFEIITENVAPNPDTDTDLEISIASKEQKAKVIADAIKAVREGLHEKGVVHKDIKPGNIIVQIDKNGVVKGYIIDFGLAEYVRKDEKYGKDVLSDRAKKQVVHGTPGYFDPEIFYEYDKEGKYSKTRSVKEMQELSLRPETDQFSFAVSILAKIFGFSAKRFMSENNLNSKQFTLALLMNFELYRNALIKSLVDVQDEQLKEILHISIMRMKDQKKAAENYEKKYGSKPNMKELEIRLRTLVH